MAGERSLDDGTMLASAAEAGLSEAWTCVAVACRDVSLDGSAIEETASGLSIAEVDCGDASYDSAALGVEVSGDVTDASEVVESTLSGSVAVLEVAV